MSFRSRLLSFFVLIVVVPMVAVGFLVFRLIGDSAQGKADARANGIATAAASIYSSESAAARADARTIARDAAVLSGPDVRRRIARLATRAGLTRVMLSIGPTVVVDVGDRTSIAPGVATVISGSGGKPLSVTVSSFTALDYVRHLTGRGIGVVVRQAGQTLASTFSSPPAVLPAQGNVTIGSSTYRSVTQSFPGFGGPRVEVTVLSNLSATASSVRTSRVVAAVFIVGFLLLAFSFSMLASRALQGQLGRFLEAARRLGGGDFSAPVPTEGRDEFAALGAEFNSMSQQLARRLDELSQERARLRESIRRIGQTFASNLDRPALLELSLRTAVDAVQARCGRLSVRASQEQPLVETFRIGGIDGLKQQILEAERKALRTKELSEAIVGELSVASIGLGPIKPDDRVAGLITVARNARLFSDDDRELLRSLAAQTTLALENIELHYQVQRQAVTDDLTALANHGRFQELLSGEIEQVRRYRHPVGLIMLDIDDFKTVNDSYGHLQGDVVLKAVARVLRETSRETDTPARYGGEEMALILPHTDLDGSYAIAERVRTAIEALRIPRLDHGGILRVTASLGVAASADGDRDTLLADADSALYTAKRQGKNRTVRAAARAANVFTSE
jgi:diguanylate cyclase (GGDEF)-like protein